ncbi:MAG: hypothetical protein IJ553_05765 [Alloprevotella sp.]|nr:hypothetical protein [Alloprevotella sp.]
MKYENLRNKTIFDFCDKEEILQEITSFDKTEYLEMFSNDEQNIAVDLLTLAELTNNKALESSVEYEYANALSSYRKKFNEK